MSGARPARRIDGWEGILVEQHRTERFIYRQDRTEVASVEWPLGMFCDVTEEGCRAFEQLARSLIAQRGHSA
jgi:hypothetical protein